MKKIFLAIALVFSFTVNSEAQDYQEYNNLIQYQHEDHWDSGTYYVLVSANWCDPCKELKQRLKKYPKQTIYTLDLDSDKEMSSLVMGDQKTIPCLVKYDVTDIGSTKAYYVYPNNLDSFIIEPETKEVIIKEEVKESPVQEEPVSGIIDRVLENISNKQDETNNYVLRLIEDRESVFQKL